MSWDNATTRLVTTLWQNERLSASEIAARIGKTRNAVISKLHRMGLTSADGGSQTQPSGSARNAHGLGARPRRVVPKPAVEKVKAWRHWGAPAAAASERKIVEPYRETPAPRVFDPAKMVRTVDLENHHCRWPIGDPQEWDSFRHCGERKEPGIPYCARCAEVAYRENAPATGVNLTRGGQIDSGGYHEPKKSEPTAGDVPRPDYEEA